MASKPRGRNKLVNCDSCGRRIPRDKAVTYDNVTVYATEMKSGEGDDVRTMLRREQHFCPSCGKHRRIYEKKGRQAARRAERWGAQDQQPHRERWGRQEGYERVA